MRPPAPWRASPPHAPIWRETCRSEDRPNAGCGCRRNHGHKARHYPPWPRAPLKTAAAHRRSVLFGPSPAHIRSGKEVPYKARPARPGADNASCASNSRRQYADGCGVVPPDVPPQRGNADHPFPPQGERECGRREYGRYYIPADRNRRAFRQPLSVHRPDGADGHSSAPLRSPRTAAASRDRHIHPHNTSFRPCSNDSGSRIDQNIHWLSWSFSIEI
ncbi:hypothetical protein D3C72_1053210 [compost metagenome]